MLFPNKLAASTALLIAVVGLMPARASIQTWNGGTGDWSEAANWTTAVPAVGDDVVITNRGALVLLTNSTPWLSSLAISNASLSCSNWNTTIYVTNLTILSSGILTCAGPFTNTAMSNRVSVVCTNLLVETKGAINVQGKGFAGGIGPGYGKGNGPGGGGSGIAGGSYGGYGRQGQGWAYATNIYGSASAPLDPGSGGCGGAYAGDQSGHGGGAVCITAIQMTVNGSINANGSNVVSSTHGAGGSGGGIYITCATITGTNGLITANAANPQAGNKNLGGGAGGGRIAVHYNPELQDALPIPSLCFSAAPSPSAGLTHYLPGDIGTLYFTDSRLFSPTNLFTGQWLAPGFTNRLTLSDWTISNVWLRVPGFDLTVSNTLLVAGTNYLQFKLEITNKCVIRCGALCVSAASLALGMPRPEWCPEVFGISGGTAGPTLNCTDTLILTNAARFYIYAGLTNEGEAAGNGARINVGGETRISTNCWVYPAAHPTNGAIALFSLKSLTIDQGGAINADSLGYAGGRFPGTTKSNVAYGLGAPNNYTHGAGYGGAGALGYWDSGPAGAAYGMSNAPEAGSGARGGGNAGDSALSQGAYGGGCVRIQAADTVVVKGAISANGGRGCNSYGGGGSGGGIYITCRTFIGDSNALLQAKGGNAQTGTGGSKYDGGGGGGGRIAVWRIFDRPLGVISNDVSGGCGWAPAYGTNYGASGTVVWGWIVPPAGSIVSVY